VSDGDRRIVAVVLGGQTGKSRDNHMAELIRTWLPKASTRRGSGDLVAKAGAASNSPIRALTALLPGAKEAPRPKPRPEEELTAFADTEEAEVVEQGDAEPDLVEQAYAAPIPARMADIDPISTAAVPKSGWSIQVASSPSEVEARAFLTRTTRQAGDALADASPYTMTFEKGGVTYYRARFGGFQNKGDAWDACKALKRKKIECYAVEQ
jgi:D-alanyl-D-alanine carboxypeptidase